jgi:hypothetical protein
MRAWGITFLVNEFLLESVVELCTLNQVDPCPITWSLSNP